MAFPKYSQTDFRHSNVAVATLQRHELPATATVVAVAYGHLEVLSEKLFASTTLAQANTKVLT